MEQTIQKKYFTIAEVSERINIPKSTIRFWEDEFEWIEPKRNNGGNRRYTELVISDILNVAILVKVGDVSNKGIKKAYAMGFLVELVSFYVIKTRKYRPECSSVIHQVYPTTIEEAFKIKRKG